MKNGLDFWKKTVKNFMMGRNTFTFFLLFIFSCDSKYSSFTDLEYAVSKGDFPRLQLLQKRGADLKLKDRKTGKFLLHYGAENNQSEIIEFLLKEGLETDLPDKEGRTPLFYAMKDSHIRTQEILYGRGSDLHRKTKSGSALLHYAAMNGAAKTIESLIRKKMRVDEKDSAGNTALHTAAMHH
ncbi:MAG TPA: ankyrin repeat domain-containing protein, partial [Leptospiraceae bacterium]|nr:ankyrin repeat domain-containing protein [Leptospiraceae bacterium]